jgi:hypothetical protein
VSRQRPPGPAPSLPCGGRGALGALSLPRPAAHELEFEDARALHTELALRLEVALGALAVHRQTPRVSNACVRAVCRVCVCV